MSATDELVAHAREYTARFDKPDLPMPPSRRVAVVACMDARLNVYRLLGLAEGEAHVVRNAGRRGGQRGRPPVAHDQPAATRHARDRADPPHGLRMLTFTDDEFKATVEADTGIRPAWATEAFTDPEADVRQSMARIQASPFPPYKNMRGFVFDVKTGALGEVV